ncbi:MAG TPA: tetratricopeptide repeat protein [Polyangia bacterium]|nr:tetratricopeptide repeat protein [Polyangia bacterium]
MRQLAFPIALVLVGLAWLPGCLRPLPPPQEAEATGCVHDAQCKGERICEQAVCVGTAKPFAIVPEPEVRLDESETPQAGCEDGNPQACYEAGMRSVFGVDGPEDLGQARGYFHRACRAGHVYACMNLGLLLEPKPGSATDPRKCRVFAVDTYDKACDQGHAEACYTAARLHDGLTIYTIPRDKDRSRKLFKRACDLGYQDACKQVPH